MQRAISGYNMLMILTAVDNKLHADEDMVIRNWLTNAFNVKPDLDTEMEKLSNLSTKEYAEYFQQQMDTFYTNSSLKERNEFMQFVLHLIKADGSISKEENLYFNMLFEAWNDAE
jgi:uncharacterized tellurite resistance protein B-like protein